LLLLLLLALAAGWCCSPSMRAFNVLLALCLAFASGAGTAAAAADEDNANRASLISAAFTAGAHCTAAEQVLHGEWMPGPDLENPSEDAYFMAYSDCTIPEWQQTLYTLREVLAGKTIFFVGDSQTMSVFRLLKKNTEKFDADQTILGPRRTLRYSPSRDTDRFQQFYGLSPTDVRPELKRDGIGPALNGLKNAHETDCSGCTSEHVYFPLLDAHVVMHTMEFAKDTEQYSKEYSYTQEAIFRSYARRYPPDYVVWNNGIHDMNCATADQFESNVRWTMDLILSNTPASVLYWSCLQPKTQDYIQTRELVLEFNERAQKVVRQSPINRVSYLDISQVGEGEIGLAKHIDNIHMENEAYELIIHAMILALAADTRT
jgi:hypothetical protein